MNFNSYFLENRTLDVFKMTYQFTEGKDIVLPSNLSTLSKLKELNIIDISLALFSNFENLESLGHLKVINASIGRIPQSTNQWPALKTLELSNVTIRGAGHIPDIFVQMDSLQEIYIGETRITTTAQKNIYKSPNLKELTFSFCEISAIQPEIGNLTSLEELIITADQTNNVAPVYIPQTIGSLVNLKSIFLSTGGTEFPAVLLGLKSNLESLALADDIGIVPTAIGDFTNLKELSFPNCGLSNLPSTIQNLSGTLLTLNISGNNFSESTKQQLALWLPSTQIIY
jgi:Leucine-rich repeat (LRR) protein